MSAPRFASASERDEHYMGLALAEAAQAVGRTSPNPMVGCVIVRDGEIVGRGHHERAGSAHAEVAALREAGDRARGAELFVSLEPCSHHGRTPPCAEAVVQAGLRRVVAGMIDPDPRVSGRGMQRLIDAGIETRTGVLEDACRELNKAFITHVTLQRPYVTLKLAASLDGRIATRTGDSKWITGPASRQRVHQLRDEVDAIVVGSGTLRADNPQLTTRLDGSPRPGRSPHRYVLDPGLRLDPALLVFDTRTAPVTVLHGAGVEPGRAAALRARGVELVEAPTGAQGRIAPAALLRAVRDREQLHLLVEGGGEFAASFLESGCVDRLLLFLAPVVLGGRDAVPVIGGAGAALVAEAARGAFRSIERTGEDVLLDLRLQPAPSPEPAPSP